MARAKNKDKENRTKQVQIVVPKSLSDQVKLKARANNESVNELANKAIIVYMATGGDNIRAEANSRMILMVQPTQYNMLSELAHVQGISVNQCVTHALTDMVANDDDKKNKPENLERELNYYRDEHKRVQTEMSQTVSKIASYQGAVKADMKNISKKNKKELQADIKKLLTVIDDIYDEIKHLDSASTLK